MITGDPAFDAWLTLHGHFIAAAVLATAAAVLLLPGLLDLLGQEDES